MIVFEKIKQLTSLFDKKDKISLLFLLVGMSIVGILEMIMVAMIFPFLSLAIQPQVFENNKTFHLFLNYISIDNTTQLIILLGSTVLFLLISGNIFLIIVNWFSLKEVNNFGNKISVKLFENYLNKPYHFFFKRHSAELTKNILTEAHRIVVGILSPFMQVASKIISSFLIVGILFYMNPRMAITIALVFIFLYFILFKTIKKNLIKKGKQFSVFSASRHKAIVEAFNVVKNIQILGKQKYFLDQFKKSNTDYFNVETELYFVPYFTKYLVETIIFSLVVLMIIYLTVNEDFTNALPILGMYVVAGYRLLPAVQQIFNGISQIHSHWEAVNIIRDDCLNNSEIRSRSTKKIRFKDEMKLIIENFGYEKDFDVLKKIKINIRKNSMVAFVGTTGSGKTTVIDLILGLLSSETVKLMIDEHEVSNEYIDIWQNNVGYVSQDICLLDDSILANIAFGIPKENICREQVIEAAKMADIHDYIMENLTDEYDTALGENGIKLSGGQKQRIGIARALYHKPQVLVLDEATSALDNITESKIMHSVKALSAELTIILIAHRLSTVEECDKIFVFNNGEILAEGAYVDLLKTCEHFKHLARVA